MAKKLVPKRKTDVSQEEHISSRYSGLDYQSVHNEQNINQGMTFADFVNGIFTHRDRKSVV